MGDLVFAKSRPGRILRVLFDQPGGNSDGLARQIFGTSAKIQYRLGVMVGQISARL